MFSMYCTEVLSATMAMLLFASRAQGSFLTVDSHLSLLQQHATLNAFLNRTTGCSSDDDCIAQGDFNNWRCCPTSGGGNLKPCRTARNGVTLQCQCASTCANPDAHCGPMPVPVDVTKKHVLVLGDSVSSGYTYPLKDLMIDTHKITRAYGASNSNLALHCLDSWLEFRPTSQVENEKVQAPKWDLVTLNVGLHDSDDSVEYVSLSHYRRNLEYIVKKLQAFGVPIMWVTTTPIGADCEEAQMFEDDDSRVINYNRAAEVIMSAAGIDVCDLHSEVVNYCGQGYGTKGHGECGISPCNPPQTCHTTNCMSPHFTDAGYKLLAHKLSECIKAKIG